MTDGVARVRDAGASLSMIGSLVESLSEHIEAIAIARDEQALGLKEVNLAVNTLDGVTQRNALMVEENDAACRALANESTALRRVVEEFALGDDGSAAIRAA